MRNVLIKTIEYNLMETYVIFIKLIINDQLTLVCDSEISKFLNININEYRKLLNEYGCCKIENECFFDDMEKANLFVNKLQEIIDGLIIANTILNEKLI